MDGLDNNSDMDNMYHDSCCYSCGGGGDVKGNIAGFTLAFFPDNCVWHQRKVRDFEGI